MLRQGTGMVRQGVGVGVSPRKAPEEREGVGGSVNKERETSRQVKEPLSGKGPRLCEGIRELRIP